MDNSVLPTLPGTQEKVNPVPQTNGLEQRVLNCGPLKELSVTIGVDKIGTEKLKVSNNFRK